MKRILCILLLLISISSISQDTLKYDTIIIKNGNRSVYHFDGYWLLSPDTLFNTWGTYKLKVPTVHISNEPNTYYYKSYGKYIMVKQVGNSVIVMDRYRKSTTLYRRYGPFKYCYFSF